MLINTIDKTDGRFFKNRDSFLQRLRFSGPTWIKNVK